MKEYNDVVYGINAITELLKTDINIDCMYIADKIHSTMVKKIISICKEKNILIKYVHLNKINNICGTDKNQGIAATISSIEYVDVSDILDFAKKREEDPFLIIAYEIFDTHNLGAIIRTAESCGAHGIILPKRSSAPINEVVHRTSAGASLHIMISRVTNINSVVCDLKKQGIWVYASDMDGQDYSSLDYKGPLALVIGSEGAGIPRLLKQNCDFVVSIPMKGKINSLNASVSSGILMYKIVEGRKG